MRTFDTLGKKKVIIGMVHLGPMPGTPYYKEGSYPQILERAVADGTALFRGGASGCLVQTIDRVYSTTDEADPARIAAVANIVREIAKVTGPEVQIGVQILRNAIQGYDCFFMFYRDRRFTFKKTRQINVCVFYYSLFTVHFSLTGYLLRFLFPPPRF